MAKELPYFKFEPNQWENGKIQIVPREDKGLFIDLCSMYWSRLGEVPLKLAVQKLCGGNAVAFDLLIDEGLFLVKDGYIYIEFLSEQLNEFENQSETNSRNALSGWEKRRSNAAASKSQSETNAIREEKIKEDDIKVNNSIPPKIEEIKEYCIERKNNVDANKFIDFYSAKGWMIGKNKMKDWKAAVRTWEGKSNSNNSETKKDSSYDD